MAIEPENDEPFGFVDNYVWYKNAGAVFVVLKDRPHELCVMTGQDGWETPSLDEVDQMYEALGKIRQWLHETKGE